jgi:hypothetical protein
MTFAEVADEVGGVKRLVNDVYVAHADETAENHPYFDLQAAAADRDVDIALTSGGYETPLASLTDPKLRTAWLGLVIGYLSKFSSDRQQWMKDAEESGRADLAAVASRQLKVLGAIEADESDDASGAIFGQFEDNRLFSVGDPYSDMNSVYGSLGPGPRRFGRSSR